MKYVEIKGYYLHIKDIAIKVKQNYPNTATTNMARL